MGKGSKRRPGNTEAYRRGHKRAFGTGPRDSTSGTFVLRNGTLVPGRVNKCDSKNIESLAAGVQAEQAPQARKDIAEAKLSGVKVLPNGNYVFATRRDKLRFLKHAKMHDRDEVRG